MSLFYKAMKSKKGAIFFSKKSFSLLKRDTSKITSFVSQTGRTFVTGGDRRFEKLSGGSGSSGMANVIILNLRKPETSASEPPCSART